MRNAAFTNKTIKTLSVVVPAFNVENYIDRCIESLEKQGNVLQQIVIVNDGSTDSTLDHIYALKERFDNITILNQENQGPYRARLNGVGKVQTEWVTFCDSDDYIDEFFYEKISQWMDEDKADIIEFGYRKIAGNQVKYEFLPAYKIMDGSGAIRRILEKDDSSCSNCNKLYKTALFCTISSQQQIPQHEEDKYINVNVMCKADSIMSVPIVGYNYDTRKGSITTHKKTLRYFTILDSNKIIYDYIKGKRPELCQTAGYDYCAHLAFCYIVSSEIEMGRNDREQIRKQIRKEFNRIYQEAKLGSYRPQKETVKRHIMMKLFRFSPSAATMIGNIANKLGDR